MLPAQRRQELQQLAVHRLAGLDQPLGGAFRVHRVPQHDSRRHQVEAAGPVALLLEAPIPDFPKAVEEHRPGQRVARLGTVAKLAMRQPFCLIQRPYISKNSAYQGAFRPGGSP